MFAQALAPSISDEYLCPKAHTKVSTGQLCFESQHIADYQVIASHPLLPLVSEMLHKRQNISSESFTHASQSGEGLDSDLDHPLLDCSPEADAFMRQVVLLTRQLSGDRNIGELMQSIENECSYFTSEMSMFCQNLLKQEPSPTKELQSTELIQQSPSLDLKKEKPQLKLKSEKVKKRVRLSLRNSQILREWLLEHADNPFPTDSEKDALCLRTGLSISKLNMWFVNSRRRVLAQVGLKNYHKDIAELNKS